MSARRLPSSCKSDCVLCATHSEGTVTVRKLVASTSVTSAEASGKVGVVAGGTVFTVGPGDVAERIDATARAATVSPSVVTGAASAVVDVITAPTPAKTDGSNVAATNTVSPNTESRHPDIVPPYHSRQHGAQ